MHTGIPQLDFFSFLIQLTTFLLAFQIFHLGFKYYITSRILAVLKFRLKLLQLFQLQRAAKKPVYLYDELLRTTLIVIFEKEISLSK